MKKEHYELILGALEVGIEGALHPNVSMEQPPLIHGPIPPSSVTAIVLVDDVPYSVTIEATTDEQAG